jgi:ABC-type uncharacterized transport system involved in gliding motility auxiliary subunit
MSTRASGNTALIVAFVLFLALNGLVGMTLRGARIDLTEQGLYTLTDGTRSILANLDEPISLRYYFSRGLAAEVPQILTYANRVGELLDEYVAAADGGLRLVTIDPAPFSEEEDEAVSAGVQGLPVPPAGDLFYFGLVATNSTDATEVIRFFDPSNEQFLEYDLTRFIDKLAHTERPKIGVLSALPMGGTPAPQFPGAPPQQPGWYVLDMLAELFEVELLDPFAEDIPGDVELLFVVHPKAFSDGMLFAIDQFVLAGGRALVMVDPHSEEDAPPQDPNNPLAGMGTPRGSDLGPLLAAWGVQFDGDKLLADRASALTVTSPGAAGAQERVPYLVWVQLDAENTDQDDPVLAGLGGLIFAAAGVLKPTPDATTSLTPMVWSSEDSSTIATSSIQFFPQPKDLIRDFFPGKGKYTVAARITGPALTAFPDGVPGEADDAADDDEPEAAGAEPVQLTASDSIHVIVVADADMAADRWWVRFQNFFGTRMPMQTASNGNFVLNVLESLSGSTDLISVRSRGRSERPFDTIDELRRQAELDYQVREQELQQELRETERRLNELQTEREDGSSQILTAEQRSEIARFQDQRVTTRKALRAVKHDLSKDIESLQDRLKFANVLGVPLLVLMAALSAWLIRRKQRT